MTAGVTFGALLDIVALLLFVPCVVFFLEVVAARRPTAAAPVPSALSPARLAVLMPAHDEGAGIAASIRSVLEQLLEGDRLLVVADNCSDDTAAVARSLGASVVERHDAQRRGKGYALDFGVRELEHAPPDIVVVVDADCILGTGALTALRRTCLATGRPVQALYLMLAPPGAGLGQRVAAFGWAVKNRLRPRGAARLGWPCQLMGTGMAFKWLSIQNASLASGHLVEDMQLGLEMALAGTPPIFCEEALVSSQFPSSREGIESQRTRWEQGHLATIVRDAPRLAWHALRRVDLPLLALTLDLAVPPLASLVLVQIALGAAAAAWWTASGDAIALSLAATGVALVVGASLLAWQREGRAWVAPRELLFLPWYVMAKIPMYVRVLVKRQRGWIRTKRDAP